jgi:hypothetical protein
MEHLIASIPSHLRMEGPRLRPSQSLATYLPHCSALPPVAALGMQVTRVHSSAAKLQTKSSHTQTACHDGAT